jgi:uncharacterized repeat protein (TIGR03837 family)
MPQGPSTTTPIWRTCDIFCRVVDNFGDLGVCWRLAKDLASTGMAVRLVVDDATALQWMAPNHTGVAVLPWPSAPATLLTSLSTLLPVPLPVAELVIETFGCGLPAAYLAAMVDAEKTGHAAVWINLEYLSAEPYVERSHLLPSLQNAGPGRGLTCHFFYPGFTTRTGGLLREADLAARRAAHTGDVRDAWLAAHGVTPRPGERLVSLFCYANPNLPGLLRALAEHPTLLLTTPGHATSQVAHALAAAPAGGFNRLRTHALPWLSQTDYDRLLWSCDINFVRGEDSLVRAIWSAQPCVWQIYPQPDGAHAPKLQAYFGAAQLQQINANSATDATPRTGCSGHTAWQRAWWRWNGLACGADETEVWAVLNCADTMAAWRTRSVAWRDSLAEQPDLRRALLEFATSVRVRKDAKI